MTEAALKRCFTFALRKIFSLAIVVPPPSLSTESTDSVVIHKRERERERKIR